MANDGLTIKIKVSNSDGGGGDEQNPEKILPMPKQNRNGLLTVQRAVDIAKQFGAQIVDKSVSMIGLSTGNYALQNRLQRAIGIGSKAVGIGVSFAINPVLGTISLVGEGVNFAFEAYAQTRQIAWQNRSAEEMARRAGYLSDGNRGRK